MSFSVVGYLLSYKPSMNSDNIWMKRFNTKEEAEIYCHRLGIDTPEYCAIINPIVDLEPKE